MPYRLHRQPAASGGYRKRPKPKKKPKDGEKSKIGQTQKEEAQKRDLRQFARSIVDDLEDEQADEDRQRIGYQDGDRRVVR